VLADAKAHGTPSPVAPGVRRPDAEVEEFCELVDGEKAVVVFHVRIIEENPVTRVSLLARWEDFAARVSQQQRVLSNLFRSPRLRPMGGCLTGLLTFG